MNCEGWRVEIAAFLDGNSDPRMISRIHRHLDTCRSCLEFYREQSELNAVLGSSDLELEPPEYLWYQIESRMGKSQEVEPVPSFVGRMLGLWSLPRLRYAVVSFMLLLAVSWSLFELKTNRESNRVLARIDACQMKVDGNPFLSRLEGSAPAENPFFSLGTSTSNPFESKRSSQ